MSGPRAQARTPGARRPASLLKALLTALLTPLLVVVLLQVALLQSGCGDDRSRRVHPELVPPPQTFDFGAAPVLNERRLVLPLQNVGRAALSVMAVRVKEDGTPFSVGEFPPEVARGVQAQVDVFFKPPAERAFHATLLVETDDPLQPLLELPLSGEGRTRAVMEVTPRELCNFGRTPEGGGTLRTLTVRSLGSADLLLEELSFAPDSSPAFSFVGSARTPAVVKTGSAGMQLTVKYSVPAGAPGEARGGVRIRSTDPDQPEVVVPLCGQVNRAPVPVIAPLPNAAPGQTVVFDGSGSYDPDGNTPLRHSWRLVNQPAGSRVVEGAKDQATFQLKLDDVLPGAYEVELTVTDADPVQPATSVQPARARVVATPAQALLVELSWNNSLTDVDLHLLRTPETPLAPPFHATEDCHYSNCRPAQLPLDWGQVGVTADDPVLLRDWLRGYGPEVTGVVEPAPGRYRVAAYFQNPQTAADPTSKATVRVYVRGVLMGEYTHTLTKQGDRWPVVDVDWPSGALTPIPLPTQN